MERQILHVDVNNAFLSWSAIDMLENGSEIDIRTIPAIIGGDESKRSGIVLAKSPIAKSFGIVTGEPIYFAKKKCPGLQVFRGDFEIYHNYSNKLYNLLLEYTDVIERFSIDECFLDMTGFLRGRDLKEVACAFLVLRSPSPNPNLQVTCPLWRQVPGRSGAQGWLMNE